MRPPISRTLPALLAEMASVHGAAPAVTDDCGTTTFAGFRSEVLACAKALHAAAIGRGDKVGILMGNRTEWLVVSFAAQQLGATTVALNTWYTGRELAYVIEHADVALLVAADRFLKTDYVALLGGLDPLGGAYPVLRRVVILGDVRIPDGWQAYDAFLAGGSGVADEEVEGAEAAVRPDDIAFLLYTSGSTSRPKGVMLEHAKLIENGFNVGGRLRLDEGEVLFLPVSLFWGLGCENAMMAAWTRGVHVVLQSRFDPVEAMRLIERHRCSAIYGTANIIHLIFEHPDAARHDLSSLRKGMAGGSRRVIDHYLPLGCRAYGLTETYGYATLSDADDPADLRADSFGKPVPGNEMVILSSETGERLPAGAIGEVRLRGFVMAGYYKNPEQTAEAFDADGFFKTGDYGYLDEDGFFYFKGRLKEMLKTGGMNVSPAEVEDVLKLHPKVADAYVTGLPDPVRDQAVAAVLLLASGEQATAEEVLDHCRAQLAAFKVPRHLRFVSYGQLPFTTTGKVHKQRLHELFETSDA